MSHSVIGPTSTQGLRNDILKIREDLRAGKISNAVARTLLFGAKAAIDTVRIELSVATLGSALRDVEFNEKDRQTNLKVAA